MVATAIDCDARKYEDLYMRPYLLTFVFVLTCINIFFPMIFFEYNGLQYKIAIGNIYGSPIPSLNMGIGYIYLGWLVLNLMYLFFSKETKEQIRIMRSFAILSIYFYGFYILVFLRKIFTVTNLLDKNSSIHGFAISTSILSFFMFLAFVIYSYRWQEKAEAQESQAQEDERHKAFKERQEQDLVLNAEVQKLNEEFDLAQKNLNQKFTELIHDKQQELQKLLMKETK